MSGPIPAVLLAAGGSTRMSRTKQLLPYRSRTLVWHAASQLLAAGFSPAILVTGNDAQAVAEAVQDLPVTIHHHPAWQAGIGSSLRAGVQCALTLAPTAPAILITLADQPGVSADHLQRLLASATPAHIAASHYAAAQYDAKQYGDRRQDAAEYVGTMGVPTVFPAVFFEALLTIPDTGGAKSVLNAHAAAIRPVPLHRPEDIDSPSDFATLLVRDGDPPPRTH